MYFAGKAAGWYMLANESESSALPRFEYHYARLCRQVIAGEKLTIDAPQPLSRPDRATADSGRAA